MKTSALPGLLLALAGAAWAPAACAQASPDEVFQRYLTAVHRSDMAAVRSLIAPDVERSDFVGCTPAMDNPACLAHYIQATVVGPRARLTVLQQQVDGEQLSATLEVRSPLYAQAGVERIVGRDILTVRQGLIRSFRFVPDFSDAPTASFFASLGIGPRAVKPASQP